LSTAPGIDLPAPATGTSLVAIYQTTLLVYLVSVLYLYPYGIPVAPDDSEAHVVRALNVCRLGLRARDEPPEAVLPEYLREPDAKPRQ